MNINDAKQNIDTVIKKGRVHLYKPIQVAEILHRDRINKDIDLSKLETYRNESKKWRNIISMQFLGRISTSSARYQDDLFNENAVPSEALVILGQENRNKNGIVEAYIYQRFSERYDQLINALNYATEHDSSDFKLSEFINSFWEEPGLRRSIDKIYEIVVYALFLAIIEALELKIDVSYNPSKSQILEEFQEFADKVINLTPNESTFTTAASIYRVGTTNAADRGLDMWANFGLAIQIKHLTLDEELASEIVSSVSADRIIIVCKNAEEHVIVSLLNQIGWKSKIQSIVTEENLVEWYELAMRGKYSDLLGKRIIEIISDEIKLEFPATKVKEFEKFFNGRNYNELSDDLWK